MHTCIPPIHHSIFATNPPQCKQLLMWEVFLYIATCDCHVLCNIFHVYSGFCFNLLFTTSEFFLQRRHPHAPSHLSLWLILNLLPLVLFREKPKQLVLFHWPWPTWTCGEIRRKKQKHLTYSSICTEINRLCLLDAPPPSNSLFYPGNSAQRLSQRKRPKWIQSHCSNKPRDLHDLQWVW